MAGSKAKWLWGLAGSTVVVGTIAAVLVLTLSNGGAERDAEASAAVLTFTPSTGITTDTQLLFSAADSRPGADPERIDEVRYSWDFGDGTSAAGRETSHTYSTAGTYVVTLTYEVFYSEGRFTRTEASQALSVDVPPIGDLSASIELADGRFWLAGEGVQFSGGRSRLMAGESMSLQYHWEYTWDFGDGSPQVRGSSPTHAFAAPGIYTVTLEVTVKDQFGRTARALADRQVSIGNRPPIIVAQVLAAGGADEIRPERPLVLDASGTIDPDGGSLWFEWDIDGDGYPDTELTQNPSVRFEPGFSASGPQTVTLRVWDDFMRASGAEPVVQSIRIEASGTRFIDSFVPGDLGRFVITGGLTAMGEIRLLGGAVGMEFLEGKLLTFLGYGAGIEQVTIPMTSLFPAVEDAGYEVSAVVRSTGLLDVGAYYEAFPRTYLGASLGYLTCKGYYDGSCRLSIDGRLPTVEFTTQSVIAGVGVGYRWNFALLTLRLVFAL